MFDWFKQRRSAPSETPPPDTFTSPPPAHEPPVAATPVGAQGQQNQVRPPLDFSNPDHVVVSGWTADRATNLANQEQLKSELDRNHAPYNDISGISSPGIWQVFAHRLGLSTPGSNAVADRAEQAVAEGRPTIFDAHSQGTSQVNRGLRTAESRIASSSRAQFQEEAEAHPAEPWRQFELDGLAEDPMTIRSATLEERISAQQDRLASAHAKRQLAESIRVVSGGTSTPAPPGITTDRVVRVGEGGPEHPDMGLPMPGLHHTDIVPHLTTPIGSTGPHETVHHIPGGSEGNGIAEHFFSNYIPKMAEASAERSAPRQGPPPIALGERSSETPHASLLERLLSATPERSSIFTPRPPTQAPTQPPPRVDDFYSRFDE